MSESRTPKRQDSSDATLEIVAVGAPSLRICEAPQELLAELADVLGKAPAGIERLIVLPPLFANLASGLFASGLLEQLRLRGRPARAANGRGVWRAALARAARRPLRLASVRFTYPRAPVERLPLLAQHDRVHAALRELVGGLARDTRSHVIGGTALLDHPRTHWEGWPDTGNVFHGAWCFDPRGEPVGVARDPGADAPLLRALAVDPAERSGSHLLETPVARVVVAWQRRRMELPAADILWSPALDRDSVRPVRELLSAAAGGAKVAVRTVLDGAPIVAAERAGGVIEVGRGLAVAEAPDGVSWCAVRVAGVGKHCDGLPVGGEVVGEE